MRTLLLKILEPVIRFIGRVHAPFTHKLVTGDHYLELRKIIKPGGVLLSRTRGELTNVLIPGYWKHAALALSRDHVIEAIGKGVATQSLPSFMLKKDYVAYYEPAFTGEDGMRGAAEKAKAWLGLPYDYHFYEGDEAFYCGELVVDAYAHTVERGPTSYHGVKIVGEKFFSPDTIAQSTDLWVKKWGTS